MSAAEVVVVSSGVLFTFKTRLRSHVMMLLHSRYTHLTCCVFTGCPLHYLQQLRTGPENRHLQEERRAGHG